MAFSRRGTDLLIDAAILATRGLALRAACVEDMAFERALFEAARPDGALLAAALPEPARETFLDQQFQFQTLHYARVHPDAARLVVLAENVPIGRMIVDRAASGWQLVDIALLPSWRGQGIGALLLQGLLDAAERAGAPRVALTVEFGNPAHRLYQRLGFVVIEEAIPSAVMEWRRSLSLQLNTA